MDICICGYTQEYVDTNMNMWIHTGICGYKKEYVDTKRNMWIKTGICG